MTTLLTCNWQSAMGMFELVEEVIRTVPYHFVISIYTWRQSVQCVHIVPIHTLYQTNACTDHYSWIYLTFVDIHMPFFPGLKTSLFTSSTMIHPLSTEPIQFAQYIFFLLLQSHKAWPLNMWAHVLACLDLGWNAWLWGWELCFVRNEWQEWSTTTHNKDTTQQNLIIWNLFYMCTIAVSYFCANSFS